MKFTVALYLDGKPDELSLQNLQRICEVTLAKHFLTELEHQSVALIIRHAAGPIIIETVSNAVRALKAGLDRMQTVQHQLEELTQRTVNTDSIIEDAEGETWLQFTGQFDRACGELKAAYFYLFEIQRKHEAAARAADAVTSSKMANPISESASSAQTVESTGNCGANFKAPGGHPKDAGPRYVRRIGGCNPVELSRDDTWQALRSHSQLIEQSPDEQHRPIAAVMSVLDCGANVILGFGDFKVEYYRLSSADVEAGTDSQATVPDACIHYPRLVRECEHTKREATRAELYDFLERNGYSNRENIVNRVMNEGQPFTCNGVVFYRVMNH